MWAALDNDGDGSGLANFRAHYTVAWAERQRELRAAVASATPAAPEWADALMPTAPLSAAEREVCAKLGVTEAAFLATRNGRGV